MSYQVIFNACLKRWMVWRVCVNGNAEVVKTFATEQAAQKWVAARQ